MTTISTLKVNRGARKYKSLSGLRTDNSLGKNGKAQSELTKKVWATDVQFKHTVKLGRICDTKSNRYDLLVNYLTSQKGYSPDTVVMAGDNSRGTCAIITPDETEYRAHKFRICERPVKT